MTKESVTVSMTSFADFCAADPVGQLSKVRDIRRQRDEDYRPGRDFWSHFRDDLTEIHAGGSSRTALTRIRHHAKDNRAGPYASAVEGYRKFWGKKDLVLLATPAPTLWVQDRLQVKVNPEYLLRIDGTPTILKLHLKERLPLNQRLANPLLHLLASNFGADDRAVAIIDVHRGKLWTTTTKSSSMESVLRMQAAAFLVGWDVTESEAGAA